MSAPLRLVANLDATPPALLSQAVRYLGQGPALTELAPQSLAEHRRLLGARPQVGCGLVTTLEQGSLTGRGGGHYPVGAKWRTVLTAATASGVAPVVIGNGAEGEPLSRKDSALLELRPHLVLDGLACAAEALGAPEAVLWLHEGDHPARSAVVHALAERAHSAEPALRLAFGPDHYLTGEASAAARGVAGGTALPFFHRRPLAMGGETHRPTLVQNVETLARVGLIARGLDGAGSTLVSVADGDGIIVIEVPDTTSIAAAVRTAIGSRDVQAVLLGGYGGSWIPWPQAGELTLRESDLAAAGLSAGAGLLAVLSFDACGIARAAELAAYLAESSARQCGPCLFGLRALADSMGALAAGGRRNRRQARRVADFVAQVRGRGACHHPDGAARMITSALEVFAEDVAAHLRGRCLHRERGRG